MPDGCIERCQVELIVRIDRGVEGHENEVGGANSVVEFCSEREPTRGDVRLDQGIQVGLKDRRSTRPELSHDLR